MDAFQAFLNSFKTNYPHYSLPEMPDDDVPLDKHVSWALAVHIRGCVTQSLASGEKCDDMCRWKMEWDFRQLSENELDALYQIMQKMKDHAYLRIIEAEVSAFRCLHTGKRMRRLRDCSALLRMCTLSCRSNSCHQAYNKRPILPLCPKAYCMPSWIRWRFTMSPVLSASARDGGQWEWII